MESPLQPLLSGVALTNVESSLSSLQIVPSAPPAPVQTSNPTVSPPSGQPKPIDPFADGPPQDCYSLCSLFDERKCTTPLPSRKPVEDVAANRWFEKEKTKKLALRKARERNKRRFMHELPVWASAQFGGNSILGVPALDVLVAEVSSIGETLGAFAFQVGRANDVLDVAVSLMMAYKSLCPGAVLVHTWAKFSDLFEGIKDFVFPQSGFVDFIDKLKNNFDAIVKSDFVKKIQEVFLYILSTSFAKKLGFNYSDLGYSAVQSAAIARKQPAGLSFVPWIMDISHFFFTRGVQVMSTGNPLSFFHSADSYGEFFDLHSKVMIAQVHTSGYTATEVSDYFIMSASAIKMGSAIANQLLAKGKLMEGARVKAMVTQMATVVDTFAISHGARFKRDLPQSILIVGTPGIGKSTIVDYMLGLVAGVKNLPKGRENVYARSVMQAHWDGWERFMWGITFDDVGAINPNYCPNGDPMIRDLLSVVGTEPYHPPMASLEDKDSQPMACKFVIGTSNTQMFNTQFYFQTPSAAVRRFPVQLHVKVKPEFQVPGRTQLDSVKMKLHVAKGLPETDVWLFTVKKVSCNGNDAIFTTPEGMTDISWEEFSAWYVTQIHAHDAMNLTMASSSLNAWDTCKHGITNRALRECGDCMLENMDVVEPQSGRLVSTVTAPFSFAFAILCVLAKAKMFLVAFCWLTHAFLDFEEWTGSDFSESRFAYFLMAVPRLLIMRCLRDPIWFVTGMRDCAIGACTACLEEVPFDRTQLTELGKEVSEAFVQNKDLLRLLVKGAAVSATGYGLFKVFTGIPGYIRGGVVEQWDESRKEDFDSRFTHSEMSEGELEWRESKLAAVSANKPTSVGDPAEPQSRENDEDPWRRDCMIVPLPKSLEPRLQDTYAQACNSVNKLIYRISIGNNTADAVSLGGNLFMTIGHIIPDGDFGMNISLSKSSSGVTSNIKNVQMSQLDVFVDPLLDRAMLCIRELPPLPTAMALIHDDDLSRADCPGVILGRSLTGESTRLEIARIKFATNDMQYLNPRTGNIVHMANQAQYTTKEDTYSGLCGGVVVGQNGTHGLTFFGLHVCGKGKFGSCVPISTAFVEEARAKFDSVLLCAAQGCEFTFNQQPDHADMQCSQTLHPKSLLNFQTGTAIVYGSLGGFRRRFKTNVVKSLLKEQVAALAISRGIEPSTATVPVCTARSKHLALSPWLDQVSVRTDEIVEAVAAILADTVRALEPDQLLTLHPLTNDEAINGINGMKYIDGMPRSTSMGPPFNCAKSRYMIPTGEGDRVTFTPEIMADVATAEDVLASRTRLNSIFKACAKDEPVSLKKHLDEKVRVFTVGPLVLNFLLRKYFLSLVRVIMANRTAFEAAMGTNCTSPEWGVLFDFLAETSVDDRPNSIGGDYVHYDKGIKTKESLGAGDFFVALCELHSSLTGFDKAGNPCFTPRDLAIMRSLVTEFAYPLVDFFGELVQFMGGNPSGQSLTTVVNDTVNRMRVRIAFAETTGLPMSDFQKHVRLLTYGDDNIMRVGPGCEDFNHTSMAAAFANRGIGYTMADKEAVSVPYVPIEDTTFLKRSFVYDEDVGSWLAPLEVGSIMKMLSATVASKTVSLEVQTVDAVRSASREFFYHGREEFDFWRANLMFACEEHDLACYFDDAPLPSFDELKAKFHGGNLVTLKE